MAGVQIQSKTDKPKIEKLLSFFERSGVITTGIHEIEGAANHDGPTVAEIAEQHEFGLGVPERSWLRAWFDENKSQIEAQISRQAQIAIKQRESFDWAMERVALWLQASIQRRIRNQIPPPNSAETIARKGSSVPLIDTGLLRASIMSYFDGAIVERPIAPVTRKPESFGKKAKRLRKNFSKAKKRASRFLRQTTKKAARIVKTQRKSLSKLTRRKPVRKPRRARK